MKLFASIELEQRLPHISYVVVIIVYPFSIYFIVLLFRIVGLEYLLLIAISLIGDLSINAAPIIV